MPQPAQRMATQSSGFYPDVRMVLWSSGSRDYYLYAQTVGDPSRGYDFLIDLVLPCLGKEIRNTQDIAWLLNFSNGRGTRSLSNEKSITTENSTQARNGPTLGKQLGHLQMHQGSRRDVPGRYLAHLSQGVRKSTGPKVKDTTTLFHGTKRGPPTNPRVRLVNGGMVLVSIVAGCVGSQRPPLDGPHSDFKLFSFYKASVNLEPRDHR
ncbi:hypothetical protein FA15DRAFT_657581 [Coprinopsis marcescibilis]|uniref:Uncharacterized protein n=1 Tax=Coprinopsis marcescibilis TaxID=230819 RepID=A0A5C3KQA7_COPMA|nr:hypothetical protein FA15DRAFT_657581 [Coprinopsis marcescibilis]